MVGALLENDNTYVTASYTVPFRFGVPEQGKTTEPIERDVKLWSVLFKETFRWHAGWLDARIFPNGKCWVCDGQHPSAAERHGQARTRARLRPASARRSGGA